MLFSTGLLLYRMEIKVSGKIEANDLIRVMRAQQKHMRFASTILLILFGVFTVTSLIAFAFGDRPQGVAPALIFGLCLFGVFLLARYFMSRKMKKLAMEAAEQAEICEIVFDPEGIRAESESASSRTEWSKFVKVVETIEDFVFFPFKSVAWSIPKRFFERESDVETVRGLIAGKLGKKSRLLK